MKIGDTVVHTFYPAVREGHVLAISETHVKVLWEGNLHRPSGISPMGEYSHPIRFIQPA